MRRRCARGIEPVIGMLADHDLLARMAREADAVMRRAVQGLGDGQDFLPCTRLEQAAADAGAPPSPPSAGCRTMDIHHGIYTGE